jgi:2',3'-cyclic-nucleotide 2'-phosphodiesterase (5'-nucleotidase family)
MDLRAVGTVCAATLLVAAAPAQAHDGHHHHKQHKHKQRAVDVQLLSINDFHGNIAPPGTITLPGGVRTPAGGAEYLATHINALRQQNRNTLVDDQAQRHADRPGGQLPGDGELVPRRRR